MSKAKKGKHYSYKTEFKKGHKVNLGRKHSEEWKRKTSKTWFKKGNISWNKGKKLSEEWKRKIGETLKGRRAWNKGKKMTEETKKKLRLLLKGRHLSPKTEFKKGQNKGNKNPARRIEVRIKISEAKKGKPHFNQRGENHPNWKGGTTSQNEKIRKCIEYKLWREAVFARDNWTCQRCSKKGSKINVHHIYNFIDYPNLQTVIGNGITLCKKCHTEFHKIYGIKNNTKEETEKFLNKISYGKRSCY
ncbi:MAG: HNH endonuclease [Candidatus Nealsonbacteria bacterium]